MAAPDPKQEPNQDSGLPSPQSQESGWVEVRCDHPLGPSFSEHEKSSFGQQPRSATRKGLPTEGQQRDSSSLADTAVPKDVVGAPHADGQSAVEEVDTSTEGRGYSALSASMRSEQAISQFGEDSAGTPQGMAGPPSPAIAPVAGVSPKLAAAPVPSAKSQCTRAPAPPPSSACTKVDTQTPGKPVEEANDDWTWTALGVLAVGAAVAIYSLRR